MFTWNNFINFLIIVGLKSVLVFFYENFKSLFFILKSILLDILHPEYKLNLIKKYGEWAVVTGSTDGIGKHYARELARKGINIVLISRSEDKLKKTAIEIEEEFSVKTKWISADYSKGESIYEHVKTELSNVPVGILVNNVGQMYEYPQEFGNVPEDKLWNMVLLNVGATIMMTRMLVNQMKERRKGAIVNIGSITQLMPGPYFSVYSASKIFVKYFSIALQHELAPYNITVQLLNPAFIATKLTSFSGHLKERSFLVANVESFARSAVFTLGRSDETSGCLSHGIQFGISNLATEGIRTFFAKKLARIWNAEYRKKNSASYKLK